MVLKNNRLFFISLLSIFFAALLLRLPGAIFPPREYLYETIEGGVLRTVLTLFAGQLPWGLTLWSVGIVSMPLVLIYALVFAIIKPLAIINLLQYNSGLFIKEFSIYIAEAFLNPTRHLIVGRIFVAIITSFAPLAIFEFFRKKGKITAAFFSAIAFLSSPFFVKHSYSLMPDAIGLTFFTFSLLTMIGQEHLSSRKILIGGIFLGLAIAGKFPYVAFLPAALIIICLNEPEISIKTFPNVIRNILIFTAGLVIPIFIFIPFIWTAPLTLAKNILGILKTDFSQGNTSWRYLLLGIIPVFINWLELSFCIIGFCLSFVVLDKKTSILLVLSFLLFFIPQGQASLIEPRHALPTMIFLYIFAGIGIDFTSFLRKNDFKTILIILIIGTVFIFNLAGLIKDFKATHDNTNVIDSINWVKKNTNPGSAIAIPESLHFFFIPNEATLERWIKASSKSQDDIDIELNKLFAKARMKYDVFNDDNPLIPSVFCALERQKIFIYKILLWYSKNAYRPKINYDLFLYDSKIEYNRGNILKTEEILTLFQENKIDVFVSDEYLSVISPTRILRFNRYPGKTYFVYCKETRK